MTLDGTCFFYVRLTSHLKTFLLWNGNEFGILHSRILSFSPRCIEASFLHFIVHSETVFKSIVASNAWKFDGTGIFCMDRVNDLGGITNLSSMPFLSDRK